MNISIENSNKSTFKELTSKINTDVTDVVAVLTKFDDESLKGWYKEICFDNFKIGYGILNVKKNCTVDIDFLGHTIEMIFFLEGEFSVETPVLAIEYVYKSKEHNINYYANTKRKNHLKKGQHQLVRVNLTPLFFNQYLPENTIFNDFKKLIKQNKTGRLQLENHPITSEISYIINEIFNSDCEGYYRKIHLNSKVLELLLLQLNQFKNDTSILNKYIPDNDQRIVRIKDYIFKHYNKSLSLEFLCKKFGTNEFTLKKNFKSTYNNTVFGYIADLKMEKSKQLLLKNKFSINEVSEIVGYKNPQHFSTAFKKKYGISPSKVTSTE